MTTITELDKANICQLREEINNALSAIGAKYGVTLHAGNATFRKDTGTFKLAVNVGNRTNADVRDDKYAEDLKLYHKLCYPDLRLDAKYAVGKQVFVMIGYNRRGRSAPFIVRDVKTTKEYKISGEQLREARIVL